MTFQVSIPSTYLYPNSGRVGFLSSNISIVVFSEWRSCMCTYSSWWFFEFLFQFSIRNFQSFDEILQLILKMMKFQFWLFLFEKDVVQKWITNSIIQFTFYCSMLHLVCSWNFLHLRLISKYTQLPCLLLRLIISCI